MATEPPGSTSTLTPLRGDSRTVARVAHQLPPLRGGRRPVHERERLGARVRRPAADDYAAGRRPGRLGRDRRRRRRRALPRPVVRAAADLRRPRPRRREGARPRRAAGARARQHVRRRRGRRRGLGPGGVARRCSRTCRGSSAGRCRPCPSPATPSPSPAPPPSPDPLRRAPPGQVSDSGSRVASRVASSSRPRSSTTSRIERPDADRLLDDAGDDLVAEERVQRRRHLRRRLGVAPAPFDVGLEPGDAAVGEQAATRCRAARSARAGCGR